MPDPENVAPRKNVLQENLYDGEVVVAGVERKPQPDKQPPDAGNREPSGNEIEPEAQADPTTKE